MREGTLGPVVLPDGGRGPGKLDRERRAAELAVAEPLPLVKAATLCNRSLCLAVGV